MSDILSVLYQNVIYYTTPRDKLYDGTWSIAPYCTTVMSYLLWMFSPYNCTVLFLETYYIYYTLSHAHKAHMHVKYVGQELQFSNVNPKVININVLFLKSFRISSACTLPMTVLFFKALTRIRLFHVGWALSTWFNQSVITCHSLKPQYERCYCSILNSSFSTVALAAAWCRRCCRWYIIKVSLLQECVVRSFSHSRRRSICTLFSSCLGVDDVVNALGGGLL